MTLMPLATPDQKNHLHSYVESLARLNKSIHTLFVAQEKARRAHEGEIAKRDTVLDKIRQYAGKNRPLVVVLLPEVGVACVLKYDPQYDKVLITSTSKIITAAVDKASREA